MLNDVDADDLLTLYFDLLTFNYDGIVLLAFMVFPFIPYSYWFMYIAFEYGDFLNFIFNMEFTL